jgi:hypothetical protein
MTPILTAEFNNITIIFNIAIQKMAFTTNFYILDLEIDSVIISLTIILYGKRFVYLIKYILFIFSSI